MSKLSLCFTILCAMPFLMLGAEGDTTEITAHKSTDMTSYGPYDEWAEFPSDAKQFQKVKMTYTLGCASGGCSEWDYTTRVLALKPTGEIDSTQKEHPLFKVNGKDTASIALSRNPTFQVRYDSAQNRVDTIENDTLEVVTYRVEGEGVVIKDTFYRWRADYYRYKLDSNGKRIDSSFVTADSTWQNADLTYYETSPVFKKMELSRVITPFAGFMRVGRQGFDNSWQRKYTFDVTDFRKLLRDSVKIRVFYEGFQAGFSATINFEFIEGQANKAVKQVTNIYQGSFPYKSQSDFEQQQMPPKKVNIADGNIEQAKVRIIPSGHGFDNDVNCAEFCKKHYNLKVNGDQIARQLMWRKDCGSNATFPQGGTWLLNRAGWCPGTRVTTYKHNVTEAIKQGDNTFNLDLEPINWQGDQRPSYNFTVQLITYSEVRNSMDAALTAIKAPSQKDAYARRNPIAMEPRVVVRNNGTQPINEISFSYGSKGAVNNTYEWSGKLKPLEERTIAFPDKIKDWRTQGSSPFIVEINEVNGGKDDDEANNTRKSPFKAPPILPKEFVIWTTTNAQPDQNSLFVIRANGDTVFQRTDFEANTRYRDSVQLPDQMAEYKLILDDDNPSQESPLDENGLFYPFIQQAGQGNFAIREPGRVGNLIKQFNANFGSRITFHFATGKEFFVGTEQPEKQKSSLNLRPNPTSGPITVSAPYAVSKWEVVDQLGRVVYRADGHHKTGSSQQLNLQHLAPGIYFLKARGTEKRVTTQKFLIE